MPARSARLGAVGPGGFGLTPLGLARLASAALDLTGLGAKMYEAVVLGRTAEGSGARFERLGSVGRRALFVALPAMISTPPGEI